MIVICDICENECYTHPCRGCGIRFCIDCERAGKNIGRDCMCRCRHRLTERELHNRNMEEIRESDHDSVVVEEPDFDATSSLGLSRQMVNRLRNRPLSRFLSYFGSIVSAGKDYQNDLEFQKAHEDRENDRYNKIQLIIERRFEDWVSNITRRQGRGLQDRLVRTSDSAG